MPFDSENSIFTVQLQKIRAFYKIIENSGRPFLYDWCFPDRILNATFDGVLILLHTIALKTPKSRENNEGRRYFDYCGITTTEYKWTTKTLTIRQFE